MNSDIKTRCLTKTLTVAALFLACTAFAQIGQDATQCGKIWGNPVGGKLDDSGCGMLRYSTKGISIDLEFSGGMVFRAHYRKADLDEKDLDSLLRLNNNKSEWEVWTIPGIPASEQKSSQWMRSDEAAMAELKDGQLSVLGSPPVAATPKPRISQAIQEASPKPAAPAVEKTALPPKKPNPAPTVQRPDTLPSVGDSKAEVLHLVGNPSGTMMSGIIPFIPPGVTVLMVIGW